MNELKAEIARIHGPNGKRVVRLFVGGVALDSLAEGEGHAKNQIGTALRRELDNWIEEDSKKLESLTDGDLACIFIREFDKGVGQGMPRDDARRWALSNLINAYDKREAEIRAAKGENNDWFTASELDIETKDPERWVQCWGPKMRGPCHYLAKWVSLQRDVEWCREVALPCSK